MKKSIPRPKWSEAKARKGEAQEIFDPFGGFVGWAAPIKFINIKNKTKKSQIKNGLK